MTSASLENLTSYTTPTQTQMRSTDQGSQPERDDTPGQKRKRTATEIPGDQDPQLQQERDMPQIPPATPHPPQAGPPNITPPPVRDIPPYEMPQFNRQGTQSPQTSPTRDAQKRRKLLNNGKHTQEANQDQAQGMEVDEEETQEIDRGNTPTIENRRQWHEDTPGRQNTPAHQEGDNAGEKEIDVTVEVDELANARTLARVLTVAEKPAAGKTSQNSPDPLDNYTKGQMPPIYDEDPATLLARIDPIQIGSWLALPSCPCSTPSLTHHMMSRDASRDTISKIKTMYHIIT